MAGFNKMKNKSIFIYIAAYLAIIIPTPGRFVYGVTLMFELVLLMLLGTLISNLIEKTIIKELKTVIMLFSLISITTIYRQIFVLIQPEVILTLGYLIYIVPSSLFLIGYLFNNENKEFIDVLKINMIQVTKFALCGLLFFLLRDIAGYGTFTFFGAKHQIFEKVIFSTDNIGVFSFIATIPGGLVLSSCIIFLHLMIRSKINILQKADRF